MVKDTFRFNIFKKGDIGGDLLKSVDASSMKAAKTFIKSEQNRLGLTSGEYSIVSGFEKSDLILK